MVAPTSIFNYDEDIATFLTEHILDEDLDTQMIAMLLSQAKNRLETEEKPDILIDENTSQSRASGDTYLSMKSLPDDFRQMLELYIGTNLPPLRPIHFRDRHKYRNSAYRYYIDQKNKQFAICGSAGAAGTIRQVYLILTNDFTEASIATDANAETCVWPKEHWPLLAWKAAEMVSSGTDIGADDLSFRMSQQQFRQYEEALHSFRMWDHDLKLKAQDNRAGYDESTDDLSLEDDILPYM